MKSKTVRIGNGSDCISHPEHGASLVLPSGREYCPHQSHDGIPKVEGSASTPWLDKQGSNPVINTPSTPAVDNGGGIMATLDDFVRSE